MAALPPPALRRPGLSVNWSEIWDAIAASDPGRTATVRGSERVTFGELEDRASRLAGWLAARGVGRGDRVACLMANRPEHLVAIYAAFKLGAAPVNLNFRYGEAELQHVLTLTRPRVVLVAEEFRAGLDAASLRLAAPPQVLLLPAEPGVGLAEAIAGQRADEAPRGGGDHVFLLTGGTTGMPRAVVYRHDVVLDSQLTSAYGVLGVEFPDDIGDAVRIATDPGLEHPVTLPITPLMHAMAFFNAMNTLLVGGSVVFLESRRFDPATALDAITAHGVSRLIIAGDAVAVPLVEELERRPGQRMDGLRTVMSSGMAWSDDTKRALLERSPAELIDILGASEGGPFAMARVQSIADLPSALRLLPGAVLLDEDGRELGDETGTVGLLAYKGATPEGYFEDSDRTAAVYRSKDGRRYLVPGDWARRDADGITLLGRGDAVVNSGGEKVFPAEVEAVLAGHPAVADCVVFGVPDPRWGEMVAAAVELRKGRDVTSEELERFVGAALAGYKKPRHISFGPVERGLTGKVRLAVLRERVTAERAAARVTP